MEEFFKSIREQRLAQKVHIANQIDFTSEVPEELRKAVENTIQKGKSFPIGTIHNGYKKVGEGKWMKVSEHGMTKKEHESKKGDLETKNGGLGDSHMYGHWLKNDEVREHDSHSKSAKRLSDKEYSDEEVVDGGEKKEEKQMFDIGHKVKFYDNGRGKDYTGKITDFENKNGKISYSIKIDGTTTTATDIKQSDMSIKK